MRSFIFLLTVTFVFTAYHAGAVCGGNFADNGDGTVKDSATGLTWKKCLVGQTFSGGVCQNAAATKTWQEALDSALTESGGWRVPNIKELQSIADVTRKDPAINTDCFPSPSGQLWIWSSSPDAADTSSKAWGINFQQGNIQGGVFKSTALNVRLVKDTQ